MKLTRARQRHILRTTRHAAFSNAGVATTRHRWAYRGRTEPAAAWCSWRRRGSEMLQDIVEDGTVLSAIAHDRMEVTPMR